MSILFRAVHSAADSAERQQPPVRERFLQSVVGRVQGRIQRHGRQLLARQRRAQSANGERALQAEIRPAVARDAPVVLRRVRHVRGARRGGRLRAAVGRVLGQRRSRRAAAAERDEVHDVRPRQRRPTVGQLRGADAQRVLVQELLGGQRQRRQPRLQLGPAARRKLTARRTHVAPVPLVCSRRRTVA